MAADPKAKPADIQKGLEVLAKEHSEGQAHLTTLQNALCEIYPMESAEKS